MFAHLHTHSEFSLLDGLARIPDLVGHARELGFKSLALTDHGNLYGIVDFYREAQAAGIKPIIGVEAYVAPGSRTDRIPGDKQPYHLVLLAKNDEGYHNLLRLVSIGHLEGFYYRPRMDREVLEQYGSGLIALSACMAGEVPKALMEGRLDDAREAALWHKKTFDGYYLEIQRHPSIAELDRLNSMVLELAQELDIPIVATNDLHYTRREDAEAHDVLLCIQTNSTVDDTNRMRMDDDGFYLKSEAEMRELFADLPEAIENAGRIADECNLDLEFNRLLLPQIELPDELSSFEYLERLCYEGFEERYTEYTDTERARERVAYELDVIRQMDFADYFLVVWDLVAYARKQGILVGVRGSAAASAVLYCLYITNIEPLRYDLVFERFLNLERKEMPDIDLDIEDERRDELIDYVTRRYGQDRVAQIITFGTFGARAGIRDVGRAMGMSFGEVDQVARLLPAGAHPSSLQDSLDRLPQFRDVYDRDPQVQKLVDTAMQLEGIARNASTHAAGVVISREPLVNVVPLQRPVKSAGSDDDGVPMTQWDMHRVAEAGLLKLDLLGLTNLTTLARTRDLIEQRHGKRIDIDSIPLDDSKTFDLLSSGKTMGLFQLEGQGMTRWIQRLQPRSLNEVSAMIALYRPGPMEHIPRYIDSKKGEISATFPHDDLRDILNETYGVIVYQDQVLQIAQRFAGYSLGQADIVRKAMGKKVREIMEAEEQGFLAGSLSQGYNEHDAREIFRLIEPFAGYAFNKAHSVSYAYIAYQTAYFKANYPREYMASLLNAHLGSQDRAGADAEECRALGLTVAPPSVNASMEEYSIEDVADPNDDASEDDAVIRVGLSAIKNVGYGAAQALVEERKANGSFRDLGDFIGRADLTSLNRRGLENLVKAGAMDELGDRATLLANAERILSSAAQEQRQRNSSQSSMFDAMAGEPALQMPTIELTPAEVVSDEEKGVWEKELTGIAFSYDPYRALRAANLGSSVTPCGEVSVGMEKDQIWVAGNITSVRTFLVRGESAAEVELQDQSGAARVIVWPDVYRKTTDTWQVNTAVRVRGSVRVREEEASIDCRQFEVLVENGTPQESASNRSRATNGRNGHSSEQAVNAESTDGAVAVAEPPVEVTTHGTVENAPVETAAENVPAEKPATGDGAGKTDVSNAPAKETPKAANGNENGSPASSNGSSEASARRVLISVMLHETTDEEADVDRLNRVVQALRSHPGESPVQLVIMQQGEQSVMTMPFQTGHSEELETEISNILGGNFLSVQQMLM